MVFIYNMWKVWSEFKARLNSGIRNRHVFFLWAFFYFKKTGNESVNHSDSQHIKIMGQFPGNSILKICKIFENAWVASICVGVWFSKSPRVFNFLRWSISYIKQGVFIWFHVNPRNFNPRNFIFLVSFSFKTIFPSRPLWCH